VRATRWIARFLLLLWAAFWLWFNIASAIGESDGGWWHIALAAITAALAVVSWFWPRIGGCLMILTGVLAAWSFHNPAAIILLAVPAFIIGVLLLFSES
jgi:hypothetical protein